MLGKLTLGMRILLSLLGAAAVLYTFSYPDSIIPRSLEEQDLEAGTISIYAAKPLLFLLPLAFMELASLLGPRRNLVWFSGLLGVLAAAVAAWPVLTATRPELVHPTFGFEDGKLAQGLLYYCVLVACSLVLRAVLLSYLFKYYRAVDEDCSGEVDADLLDPAKGLTVQQIAALPRPPKARFLFGEIDFQRIRSFHELMRAMLGRRRIMRYAAAAAMLLLGGWFFLYPQPTPQQALERDLQAMYATAAPARPGAMQLATTRAVHAAYRVMEHISDHESFAGFSRAQAEKWLRLSSVPESYRRQLRDERDITLPSVDDTFESRDRFLTVTDGTRWAVLFIRTDESGQTINLAEVQDAGWNAIADELRRLYGTEWRGAYFRK